MFLDVLQIICTLIDQYFHISGCAIFQIAFPAVTVCNQNRVDCCNLQLTIANCTADPSYCGLNSTDDAEFTVLNYLNEKCGNSDGGGSGATESGGGSGAGGKAGSARKKRGNVFHRNTVHIKEIKYHLP